MKVFGLRQKGGNEQASLKERFDLGSNTKAITGFVAARLVEKGTIHWDTKLLDIFPEWESNMLDDYKNITLANLFAGN